MTECPKCGARVLDLTHDCTNPTPLKTVEVLQNRTEEYARRNKVDRDKYRLRTLNNTGRKTLRRRVNLGVR